MLTPTGNQKPRRKEPKTILLAGILVALNVGLAMFSSCQSSRDSGSTVTGRALRFPTSDPVAFVRVLLDGKTADRIQVTDATGAFAMFHVPVGNYKVTYARFGVDLYTTNLVVDQNEQTYIVDMPPMEEGTNTLSGKVTSEEKDIGGAEIWVIYPGKGIAYTTTNDSGKYTFSKLPDGEVKILIIAKGYLTETFEDVKIGFEGTSKLEVELKPAPEVVTGRITGKVKDEEGDPIPGAYVGALPSGVIPSIYTPVSGETLSEFTGYTLELPAGTYTVVCTASGFAPQVKTAVVEENGEYTLDFTLISEETLWRMGTFAR